MVPWCGYTYFANRDITILFRTEGTNFDDGSSWTIKFRKEAVCSHFKKCQGFLSALLRVDPRLRVDANDSFNCAWIASNRAKLERFYRERIADAQN